MKWFFQKDKKLKHYAVLRVQEEGWNRFAFRKGCRTGHGRTVPLCFKVSGGNNGEDTPVPIPNTEVKLSSADDTWVVTPWESRSLPDLYESLMVNCHKAFIRFAGTTT